MGYAVHWEFKHRQIGFAYKTLMEGFTPQFTLQNLLTSLQPKKKICRLKNFFLVKKILWSCFATLETRGTPLAPGEVHGTIWGHGRVTVIFSVCYCTVFLRP